MAFTGSAGDHRQGTLLRQILFDISFRSADKQIIYRSDWHQL